MTDNNNMEKDSLVKGESKLEKLVSSYRSEAMKAWKYFLAVVTEQRSRDILGEHFHRIDDAWNVTEVNKGIQGSGKLILSLGKWLKSNLDRSLEEADICLADLQNEFHDSIAKINRGDSVESWLPTHLDVTLQSVAEFIPINSESSLTTLIVQETPPHQSQNDDSAHMAVSESNNGTKVEQAEVSSTTTKDTAGSRQQPDRQQCASVDTHAVGSEPVIDLDIIVHEDAASEQATTTHSDKLSITELLSVDTDLDNYLHVDPGQTDGILNTSTKFCTVPQEEMMTATTTNSDHDKATRTDTAEFVELIQDYVLTKDVNQNAEKCVNSNSEEITDANSDKFETRPVSSSDRQISSGKDDGEMESRVTETSCRSEESTVDGGVVISKAMARLQHDDVGISGTDAMDPPTEYEFAEDLGERGVIEEMDKDQVAQTEGGKSKDADDLQERPGVADDSVGATASYNEATDREHSRISAHDDKKDTDPSTKLSMVSQEGKSGTDTETRKECNTELTDEETISEMISTSSSHKNTPDEKVQMKTEALESRPVKTSNVGREYKEVTGDLTERDFSTKSNVNSGNEVELKICQRAEESLDVKLPVMQTKTVASASCSENNYSKMSTDYHAYISTGGRKFTAELPQAQVQPVMPIQPDMPEEQSNSTDTKSSNFPASYAVPYMPPVLPSPYYVYGYPTPTNWYTYNPSFAQQYNQPMYQQYVNPQNYYSPENGISGPSANWLQQQNILNPQQMYSFQNTVQPPAVNDGTENRLPGGLAGINRPASPLHASTPSRGRRVLESCFGDVAAFKVSKSLKRSKPNLSFQNGIRNNSCDFPNTDVSTAQLSGDELKLMPQWKTDTKTKSSDKKFAQFLEDKDVSLPVTKRMEPSNSNYSRKSKSTGKEPVVFVDQPVESNKISVSDIRFCWTAEMGRAAEKIPEVLTQSEGLSLDELMFLQTDNTDPVLEAEERSWDSKASNGTEIKSWRDVANRAATEVRLEVPLSEEVHDSSSLSSKAELQPNTATGTRKKEITNNLTKTTNRNSKRLSFNEIHTTSFTSSSNGSPKTEDTKENVRGTASLSWAAVASGRTTNSSTTAAAIVSSEESKRHGTGTVWSSKSPSPRGEKEANESKWEMVTAKRTPRKTRGGRVKNVSNVHSSKQVSAAIKGLDECSICLGELWLQKTLTLSCDHMFHDMCLKGWLVKEQSCPICRKSTDLTAL